MKFKQNIPWYKNKYLKKNWATKKSAHYIFYFFKDSLAKKNIDQIINIKEKHYKKIISFLHVQNDKIINYYLYPSLEIKKKLMGDNSFGNVIWKEFELVQEKVKTKSFEIHVLYNKDVKFIGEHEDTHLLSLPWGLSIYLFDEGLSQFLEGTLLGKDNNFLAKKFMEKGELYSLKWLLDHNNWSETKPEIIYSQVGSFVDYLINQYGLDKFKKTYKKLSRKNKILKNIKIIEKFYQKNMEEIEKEWKNKLKKEEKF
jgi:hypothetical protein